MRKYGKRCGFFASLPLEDLNVWHQLTWHTHQVRVRTKLRIRASFMKLLVYDQGYRHYPDTALPMISMVKRRERKRRARERKSTPQKTSSQAHPESIRLFTDRWRDILPISRPRTSHSRRRRTSAGSMRERLNVSYIEECQNRDEHYMNNK